MKKLLQKAEAALGVDLDGDGHVGKPGAGRGGGHHGGGHPQQNAGRGGYGAPPPQGAYGAPPPQGGGYSQQPYGGAPQQSAFPAQTGPGKGNCKALFVGINYYGQKGQLSGCVNDVKTMQNLVRKQGLAGGSYQEVVLVDDKSFPNAKYPTKNEMLNAFRWLASNNRPGDTLFFHYSGHGGQQKDTDGDEADGMDETLIPVDYKTAGQITDDTIFKLLVAPLPAGVRMTAVMDCCHSGTAMDLPFVFKASESAMQRAAADPSQLAMMVMKKDKAGMAKLGMQLFGMLNGGGGGGGGGSKPAGNGFSTDGNKHCAGDVVMLSGCSDSQTSADVGNVQSFGLPPGNGPSGAGGACTNALAAVLLKGGQMRFVDMLERMRQDLRKKGYSQVPQLSSSKPIDLGTNFSLFGPLNQARVAPQQAPAGYGQPQQNQQYHHAPANPQTFQAPYQAPPPGGNPYGQQPPPGGNPYGGGQPAYGGQNPYGGHRSAEGAV